MKLFSNRLAVVIVVMLLGILAVYLGFAISSKTTVSANKLIVGTASAYAPFVSINTQGEYEGFDIDVANELAQRMNKKMVLKDCGSMVPLMLSLKQGSSDILLWALEINNARRKEMAMIYYQGGNTTTYPLIFWQQIPQGVKTIEDVTQISNAVICCEPGSSQEKFLNKFPGLEKKSLEKVVDMVMDLKYGKSTAALIDPSILATVMEKNPELKVVQVPLDADSMSYGNGICVKKENKQLIAQVQKVVDAMKADGTIARLEQKWNLTS